MGEEKKRTIYIRRSGGFFDLIGLTPDRELPCGECLMFIWNLPELGAYCYASATRYYDRITTSNGCIPEGGVSRTVTVGKSPTGYFKVWYTRRYRQGSASDLCDFTTERTESSSEEEISFSVNTEIGCSDQEGGSYTYTIPAPIVSIPAAPEPCEQDGTQNPDLRTNLVYHEIGDYLLGYSYNEDGHWSDRGFPSPP